MGHMIYLKHIQGAPVPVINGVITSINGFIHA